MSHDSAHPDPPADGADDTLRAADAADALAEVERKRARFHGVAMLALLFLTWVLLEAPPGAATAAAILGIFSGKRAWHEYRLLAEERSRLIAPPEESPAP